MTVCEATTAINQRVIPEQRAGEVSESEWTATTRRRTKNRTASEVNFVLAKSESGTVCWNGWNVYVIHRANKAANIWMERWRDGTKRACKSEQLETAVNGKNILHAKHPKPRSRTMSWNWKHVRIAYTIAKRTRCETEGVCERDKERESDFWYCRKKEEIHRLKWERTLQVCKSDKRQWMNFRIVSSDAKCEIRIHNVPVKSLRHLYYVLYAEWYNEPSQHREHISVTVSLAFGCYCCFCCCCCSNCYRRGDGRHKTSTFRWEWGISSYIWMWISVFVCLQVWVCVCMSLASARHFTRRNFMYNAKVLGWEWYILFLITHIFRSVCSYAWLLPWLSFAQYIDTHTHTQ